MTFFTEEEFKAKYSDYTDKDIQEWQIEAVCEMIYTQVGLIYRNPDWTSITVPTAIKNASMEQMRFQLEYDIPFIDFNFDKSDMNAGGMSATLNSEYSVLALKILANAGYQYRGVPLMQNMGLNLPFGGN